MHAQINIEIDFDTICKIVNMVDGGDSDSIFEITNGKITNMESNTIFAKHITNKYTLLFFETGSEMSFWCGVIAQYTDTVQFTNDGINTMKNEMGKK